MGDEQACIQTYRQKERQKHRLTDRHRDGYKKKETDRHAKCNIEAVAIRQIERQRSREGGNEGEKEGDLVRVLLLPGMTSQSSSIS